MISWDILHALKIVLLSCELSLLEAEIDISSTWLEPLQLQRRDSASQRGWRAEVKADREREREGKEEGEESGERVGLFYLRTSRDKLLRRDATRWPELQFHKFEWRLPLSVMRSYCIILQSPYDVPSTFRSILTLSPRHPFSLLPFSLSFSLFLCLSAYLALSLSFTLYFASWPIHLTFSPSERGQT